MVHLLPTPSSPSSVTTTTMSARSKFYVPFLIAGMIFTARPLSLYFPLPSPHESPRAPATRSGPSTRTSNVSRTATRTTLCSTSSPSGRRSRCLARPFLPVSRILVSNNPCAPAGEMLCKYHHVLMPTSRLISSSQFKASYLSCTPFFDHSLTLPLPNPRMTTPHPSCSLLPAGVALSSGSLPCAIWREQLFVQSPVFPIGPSSLPHQLMNIGLLYTPVSIYQMTRGSLVLFVGVLSVLFLRRHLWLYQFCPSPVARSPFPLTGPQMVFSLHRYRRCLSRRLQRFPCQGCHQ